MVKGEVMEKFIAFFKSKGVIATLIGILISLPANFIAIRDFMNNVEMSEGKLIAVVVFNIVAMGWVILPSRIEIKSKILNFIIED